MTTLFSYMSVAKGIYNDFIKDKLHPGDGIPTEMELTTHYKVSRTTVRKALQELAKNGLVYSIQGSGTYVSQQANVQKITVLDSFATHAKKVGKTPSTKVLEFSTQPAGFNVAKVLQIKESDLVYFVRRLRLLDDEPINYEIGYMPVKMFPDLSISVMENSKYNYVEHDRNMPIKGSTLVFEPVIITPELAELLQLEHGTPVLKVETISQLKDGRFFEYTESIRSPRDYVVSVEVNRP
ncbi:MAG: GntR family transcriptional regulator [Brevinema sp.]